MEVTTDLTLFNYKYSHTICDQTACPGIEKALPFAGSGAEVVDRTIAAGTSAVRDFVIVWRDAITSFDAGGQPTGLRPEAERVAFCAPYLSISGADQVTVGFQTIDDAQVTLEYGPDANYGNAVSSTGFRHLFALDGLPPGQPVHYRTVTAGVVGDDHTFRAPPAAGTAFRFAHLGDTQFYVDQQRIDHAAIDALTQTFDPHLVLSTGDMVASEPGPGGPGGWMFPELGRWSLFFGVSGPLMGRAPFMAAMGNHEEDAPYFWEAFAFPEPDAPAIDHYDFTYGHVHFTALYTGSTDGYDLQGILDSQSTWLDQALAAADANPDVRYKVVFMHRGAFSQGVSHPTDGQSFYENSTANRDSWQTIFARHGVDLVLAGHNHNFTLARADGRHFITACSGAPVHDLRTDVIPTTLHAERTCTANLFDVGATSIGLTILRPDGTPIDEAAVVFCQAAADCEERASGCPLDTEWSCTDGRCAADCVDPPDAGTPDAEIDAGGDAGFDEAGVDTGVTVDAGSVDAGKPQDAASDAGRIDTGLFGQKPETNCGCTASRPVSGAPSVWATLILIGLFLRRREAK